MKLRDYLIKSLMFATNADIKRAFKQNSIKFVSIWNKEICLEFIKVIPQVCGGTKRNNPNNEYRYEWKPTSLDEELDEDNQLIEESYERCNLRFYIVCGQKVRPYLEYNGDPLTTKRLTKFMEISNSRTGIVIYEPEELRTRFNDWHFVCHHNYSCSLLTAERILKEFDNTLSHDELIKAVVARAKREDNYFNTESPTRAEDHHRILDLVRTSGVLEGRYRRSLPGWKW